MHMGVNTCIKWSMLELSGLLEDEDARVYFQRTKRHLGLHPYQLNDLNKALAEILSSKVNFYDSDLQGLVLAYKNPKLLDSLGSILHDSCFIHVDIEADFYIFRPEVGCTLKGIANKKAGNHLGVLVHKAFNVSILKDDDCQEWLGDYIFIGQEVKFTVTCLDFKGKLPFIRGELVPDATMGQVYYDSINDEETEEKPTTFLVNENNLEKSRNRVKKLKKSRSVIDIDEDSNEFGVKRVINDKNDYLDSEESSDDRERIKKLVSKKLRSKKINGESTILDSDNSEERKNSSVKKQTENRSSDKSIIEKGKKRASVESDSSVEEKPKIFEFLGSPRKKHDDSVNLHDCDDSNRREKIDEDCIARPLKKEKTKKNRLSVSDDDNVIEIDVEPVMKIKKKKNKDEEEKEEEETGKKKKKKKYIENEEEEEEITRRKYKVKNEDEEERKNKKKSKETENENEDENAKRKYKIKNEDEGERRNKKKSKETEDEEEEENPKKNYKVKNEDEEERKNKKKSKETEDDREDENPKKRYKVKNEDEEERKSKKKSKETEDDREEENPKKKYKVKNEDEEERKNKKKSKETEDEDEDENPKKKFKVKKEDEGERRKKKKSKETEDEDEDEESAKKKYRVKNEDEEEKKSKKKSKESEEQTDKEKRIKLEDEEERKKSKKRSKEIDNSEKQGIKDNQSDEFEFIKPDLEAFQVPAAKFKRKHRKSMSAEESKNEEISVLTPENNPESHEFFRDVRVKVEPDPSDIEDCESRKTDKKKKKKRSKSENEDDDGNKRGEIFNEITIKEEPDMSDVESSKLKKKKSKKKHHDEDTFENVKVKIEPDTSDIENSSGLKKSLKSEPDETLKRRDRSVTKET